VRYEAEVGPQRLQRARCHVLQGQHFAFGAGAARAHLHALRVLQEGRPSAMLQVLSSFMTRSQNLAPSLCSIHSLARC